MTNRSKLFIGLGIISAATAGITIGLAFAPDKGSRTRIKLKRSINDLATNLLDYIKTSKNKGEEAIDRIKSKGNELKGYAKAKVEELEEEVR